MKSRLFVLAAGLAALAALPACDSNPVGGTGADEPTFSASVQGGVQTAYQGRGYFALFTPTAGTPRPATFTLFSADPRLASREVQSFTLTRMGAEIPAVGRYPLGAQGAGAFEAHYHRAAGSTGESYTAREGEVEITRSSPERVEGKFRFLGVRSCTGKASQMVCQLSPASAADASAPTVEVSGTFAAVPSRGITRVPTRP